MPDTDHEKRERDDDSKQTKNFNLFSGWDDSTQKDTDSTKAILNERILSQRNITITDETNEESENNDDDNDNDGDGEEEHWEAIIQPVEEEEPSETFWGGVLSSLNIGGAGPGPGAGISENSILSSSVAAGKNTAEIVANAAVGSGGGGEGNGNGNVDSLVETAREFVKAGETAKTKADVTAEDFRKELQKVMKQLEAKFSDLPVGDKGYDPASFFYYMEKEDARKNPSWKRRMHRFCPGFDLETIYELHEYLYLAELAYVDTVEEIQKGLAKFQCKRNKHVEYELIFASAEGEPRKPAHFIALKKDADHQTTTKNDWLGPFTPTSYLDVTIVVRGTKEVADMLSDALLEATPYRQKGKAHDGICQSGKWIVDKHLPLLQHLLEKADNRQKIRLQLIGHSLGAGAAAIACMEFNDQPNIEATCVAFECPALLDKETSLAQRDKITTIIADADCIPRMSGATLYNLLVDVLEHDYKDRAMDDIDSLLKVVSQKVPLLLPPERIVDTMKWVKSKLDETVQPPRGLKRQEIELFPPGKCYHLYRDGIAYSFVEVACDFFQEIDVAMTMVDDHYIYSGCHAMFLALMRKHLQQSKFDFPNDLMALRMEKPPKEEQETQSPTPPVVVARGGVATTNKQEEEEANSCKSDPPTNGTHSPCTRGLKLHSNKEDRCCFFWCPLARSPTPTLQESDEGKSLILC